MHKPPPLLAGAGLVAYEISMLPLSLLTTLYYILITVGLALAGVPLLRRLPFFAKMENWILVLLWAGFFPALVSWSGFSGINKYLPLPQLLGMAMAMFALYSAYHYRIPILNKAKVILSTWSGRAWIALFGLFVVVHGAAQWCYLYGGINNTDQFRGLAFTSAFAANYLKPAHPLDLGIPVSYGYYFYEYAAFLYSAVDGHGWPSVALLVGSGLCIFVFYFVFAKFVKSLIPSLAPVTTVLSVCALSFYGLDFLSPIEYHGDWWNYYQITQMAAYWSWLYHYLLAAAFALAALLLLGEALEQQDADKFLTSVILLCIVPLYATITGVFFACVFVFAILFSVIRDKSVTRLFSFNGKIFAAVLMIAGAIIVTLGPQLFTFWGRQDYLSLHQPVLWFTQKNIAGASISDWGESVTLLGAELGLLHFLAFCFVPFCIYRLYKKRPAAGLILLSLASTILLSLSFIQASSHDWYWRGGNFGLIILTATVATWMFSFLTPRRNSRSVLLWSLALLSLVPGIWNFYVESAKRCKNCHPAMESALILNRSIDLHTAIGYPKRTPPEAHARPIPPGHPWQHAYFNDLTPKVTLNSEQDVILSMANQAGRIAIADKNPLWAFLDVYSLPADFLRQYFNWQGRTAGPCGKTWYGFTIPQNNYVSIGPLQPLKIETKTCSQY